MRKIYSYISFLLIFGLLIPAYSQTDTLFQPSPTFELSSHIVSTSLFHWYVPTWGQLSGPWIPLEGRENWTGEVDWWKSQVKQIMAANIEVLNVHLMNQTEFVRVNLFQALYEMRSEGYDVPKVAPFLDAPITWDNQPNIDLATSAGKDSVAVQYIRFYNQYFSRNTDPFAMDYLAKIDNRPILDTWHVFLNMDNVTSLTRMDLESRLSGALGQNYPVFNNGIYMVTTALNNPVFSFADERVPQFEINQYYYETTHNGIKSVQLKGGYWDQNIRNPGDFLPRDGGVNYIGAWGQIDSTIDRVYIESWNEYDEGTGIYATDTMPPYILPGSGNVNTDVWSSTNDPYEYIHTTAAGAALFNDYPELDARILRQNIPSKMVPNGTQSVQITVRNEGDARWRDADGFTFKQLDSDQTQFAQTSGTIDDALHDIPVLKGIFRGRPLTFDLDIKAPDSVGVYETHWQMMRNDTAFGEILTLSIEVSGFPSSIDDDLDNSLYQLSQNAPNPFSRTTQISFEVSETPQNLSLVVYNLMGEKVATLAEGQFFKGIHSFDWNAADFPSGIYFYQLNDGIHLETKKMTLFH